MRRLVLSVIMASGLVMVGSSSASAEPARAAAAAKAAAGKKECRIQSPRLTEVSGLVAKDDGYIAVNDGSLAPGNKRVFYLDEDCSIIKQVSFSGGGPRDTEDMVLSVDGKTLWIADVGDNDGERSTVGLWKMPVTGSKRPVIHRLTYPDGAHDAEAMLLDGDGTPIIVTKGIGKAGLYVPTGPLKANTTAGVPMRRVGEVDLPASTTNNPLSAPGRLVVTGGAVAPDGSRVVLRTYADAFEFDVTGGDVLAALQGKPRATPLPDEPQGEAITYSADGTTFLTTSDMQGRVDPDNANYILRYTPTAKAAASVKTTTATTKSADDGGQSWFAALSLQDITYLIGGVGLLGAILVGLGIFGIMRSRSRPPSAGRKGGPGGPRPGDPDAPTALLEPVREGADVAGGPAAGGRTGGAGRPSGGRPAGGGVGGRPPAGGPGGRPTGGQGGRQPAGGQGGRQPAGGQGGRQGVYGDSRPGAPQKGSGVYGGAPPAGRPMKGGVYGPPPTGQPPARPAGQPPARPAGPPQGRPTGFFGAGPAQEGGRSRPSSGQPPSSQPGPAQLGPAQLGPAQLGPAQLGPAQMGPTQVGPSSRGRFQPGPVHNGVRQQGTSTNGYAEHNGAGRDDERFGDPGGFGRSPR